MIDEISHQKWDLLIVKSDIMRSHNKYIFLKMNPTTGAGRCGGLPTKDEVSQNIIINTCFDSGCNGITSCYDVIAGSFKACNPDTTMACRVSWYFLLSY